MSDFVPLNPVGGFPNWIFCPKIVPLVYDDSLSYYEFLNKLMVKLNEVITFANQINANVEYLKEIVQRIETLVNGFDERITTNENDIADLKTAMTAVNNAIEGINSSIEDISGRVTDVENGLEALAENVQQQIDTAIIPLQTAVTNMQITIENYGQRIRDLEEAATYNLEIAPIPFTFIIDVRNGNSKGYKIVQDDASLSSNSIVWVENKGGQQRPSSLPPKALLSNTFTLPMFKNSGNPCHLVIPSIMPYKYNGGVDHTLYFYAQRWTSDIATSNSGLTYVLAVSMNSLLTVGGVQQDTASQQNMGFIDMELVTNTETGDYDLHLYNGRNGFYNAISDFTPTCIMVSTVNIDPSRTGYFQRFSNLKHCAYNQIAASLNPDGKIASAISQLRTELNADILTKYADCFKKSRMYLPTFTPTTGVTLHNNNTKQYRDTYTESGVGYYVRVTFVDLTIDIADLVGDTDVTIGSIDNGGALLDARHNLSISLQAANNGVYGSIDSNGNITIHAYGTFGASTRVRISGAIFSMTAIP